MAQDLLKILKEIRGTGLPETAATDGIYYDIVAKPTEDDDTTPRAAAGIYKSIQTMYVTALQVLAIEDDMNAVLLIQAAIVSLAADKVALDSLYADKATLDSLYADKLTLDSLYADKATLDSLFADKATLDSIFADKVALDSIFADKATLDGIYADLNKYTSTYYGTLAVEPTIGSHPTLSQGDLYFDSNLLTLRSYDGSTWADALTLTASSATTLTNKTLTDSSNTVHADVVRYRAKATVDIAKGQAVHITGYNVGQSSLEVALTDSSVNVATGIAGETLVTGEFGTVISSGVLTDLDTSMWAEGSILYVNGSGALVTTEPSVGFAQPIAYVLRSHAINGAIQISATYPKQDATDVRYLGTTSVADQIDTNASAALAFSIALG